MIDVNTPAAGIGHNQPSDPSEVARDAITQALEPMRPRLAKLLESEKRAKIDDEHDAAKITDLVAMFQTLQGNIDHAHEGAKAPWLEAGRVVDGLSAGMRDQVIDAKTRLLAKLTVWQTAEAKRISDERKAERAEFKDDPEPSVVGHGFADSKRVATRGDMGAKASLSEFITIDRVEVKRLSKAFLERPKILRVIEDEARVMLRAGAKVTGVTHSTSAKTQVRKGG